MILCFLIFLSTHLHIKAGEISVTKNTKVSEKLTVTLPILKKPKNPLSDFVTEIPLMKVISTGTLPHLSSVHFLRAQVTKNDFDIPVEFEWQNDILISDTVLLNLNGKALRSLIIQHFQNREKEENEDSKAEDVDMEWIRAPSYNFHDNQFSFIAKVKLPGDTWRFYAKTIYLLKDGYLGFQILTPYHEKLSTYHKNWSQALSIKDSVAYQKSTNPRVRDMRDLFKRWNVPFGSTMNESSVESTESNVNEKTRRTIGVTFLIFSILFFIFLNPKAKDQ